MYAQLRISESLGDRNVKPIIDHTLLKQASEEIQTEFDY